MGSLNYTHSNFQQSQMEPSGSNNSWQWRWSKQVNKTKSTTDIINVNVNRRFIQYIIIKLLMSRVCQQTEKFLQQERHCQRNVSYLNDWVAVSSRPAGQLQGRHNGQSSKHRTQHQHITPCHLCCAHWTDVVLFYRPTARPWFVSRHPPVSVSPSQSPPSSTPTAACAAAATRHPHHAPTHSSLLGAWHTQVAAGHITRHRHTYICVLNTVSHRKLGYCLLSVKNGAKTLLP